MSSAINAIINPSHPFLFVKFQEESEMKEAAKIASTNRLAVPGWSFFPMFQAVIEGCTDEFKVKGISLAYCNATGLPVACGMAFEAWGSYNYGCFVRKDFRRQGIGSMIMQELLAGEERREIRIHTGVKGSDKFWQYLGANEYGYLRD